jgi:hypothetical protein
MTLRARGRRGRGQRRKRVVVLVSSEIGSKGRQPKGKNGNAWRGREGASDGGWGSSAVVLPYDLRTKFFLHFILYRSRDFLTYIG